MTSRMQLIEPGKPIQNELIEYLTVACDECLNQRVFLSLDGAPSPPNEYQSIVPRAADSAQPRPAALDMSLQVEPKGRRLVPAPLRIGSVAI